MILNSIRKLDLMEMASSGRAVDRVKTLLDEMITKLDTLEDPFLFKGGILVNTDFPKVADVKNGWLYLVLAVVTDDAGVLYTNTGQTFQPGDEIAWNGTDWTKFGSESDIQWKDDSATPLAVSVSDFLGMIDTVTAAGAVDCNLPAASAKTLDKVVRLVDVTGACAPAAEIKVNPNGADKIDGVAASVWLNAPFDGITLVGVCIDATPSAEVYGWSTLQDAAFRKVVSEAIRDGDFAGTYAGTLARSGAGTYVCAKSGGAAVDPTVNDDETQDYTVGSYWLNVASRSLFFCTKADTGAAVWVGPIQVNEVAATPPTGGDDTTKGFAIGSYWYDTLTAVLWICESALTGVAKWNPILKDAMWQAKDPGVGEDNSKGYSVGSIWMRTDTTPPRMFICWDNSTGAAVWRRVNLLNNLAAAAAPTANDDETAGYEAGSVWIDTTADNAYVCVDNATGAAVWLILPKAAGGDLTGTYPNPDIATGAVEPQHAITGAGNPSFMVDYGQAGTCVVAMDDGAGNADRPADGATYEFSVNGVPIGTLTARDAPVGENEFQRSSAGAEEADTILMAAALAAAINAHSTMSLVIGAYVYNVGGGDGQWYVMVYVHGMAAVSAGHALTCALGGVDPGEVMNLGTEVPASRRGIFPFRRVVTAQDVLCGEIHFRIGSPNIRGYQLDILTSATDYTRIAWDGAVTFTGPDVMVDNSGGTDWAAGNVLVGWFYGDV